MDKSMIFMHGCDPNSDQWDHLFWGTPPHTLGRFPIAILIGIQNHASITVVSTAEAMLDGATPNPLLLEKRRLLDRLSRYDQFSGIDRDVAEAYLSRNTLFYKDATNTSSEAREIVKSINDLNVSRLSIISSPTHLPRCLRDVMSEIEERNIDTKDLQIAAIPSHTSYEGYKTRDVAIIEPPHRADDSGVPLHALAARLLKVKASERSAFSNALDRLLRDYES